MRSHSFAKPIYSNPVTNSNHGCSPYGLCNSDKASANKCHLEDGTNVVFLLYGARFQRVGKILSNIR